MFKNDWWESFKLYCGCKSEHEATHMLYSYIQRISKPDRKLWSISFPQNKKIYKDNICPCGINASQCDYHK